jgi:hypothetical protein
MSRHAPWVLHDSSNWTELFDTEELARIYAMNNSLTITFTPPIPCKIDTSSRPADAIAVPVSAIAKRERKERKKRGAMKKQSSKSSIPQTAASSNSVLE